MWQSSYSNPKWKVGSAFGSATKSGGGGEGVNWRWYLPDFAIQKGEDSLERARQGWPASFKRVALNELGLACMEQARRKRAQSDWRDGGSREEKKNISTYPVLEPGGSWEVLVGELEDGHLAEALLNYGHGQGAGWHLAGNRGSCRSFQFFTTRHFPPQCFRLE